MYILCIYIYKIATIIYAIAMRKKKNRPHRLYILGPEEEQQEIEAHHTILFGDGDCVKVQNKVTIFSVLFEYIYILS